MMLCVDRKPGESIFIGDSIEIIITRVQGNQVRLGIEAPKKMVILRTELLDRQIEQELKEDGYDLYI